MIPFNKSKIYFNDEAKRLRNKIRQFNSSNLISICIQKLKKEERKIAEDGPQAMKFSIYSLMLIIEFSLKYGDNKKQRKHIEEDELAKLHDIAINFSSGDLSLIEEKLDEKMLARWIFTMSYSQLWAQPRQRNELFDYSRAFYLLAENESNSLIIKVFKELYGITPIECLSILFCLYSQSYRNAPVKKEWFILAGFDEVTVNLFIENFTSTEDDVRNFLLSNKYCNRFKSHSLQLFFEAISQSNLPKKPILRGIDLNQAEVFTDISRCSLAEFVNKLPYNFLRLIDENPDASELIAGRGGSAKRKVHNRFERYIEYIMLETDMHYLTEEDLYAKYDSSRREKIVDFLLEYDKAAVLIDAKCRAIGEYAQVNPTTRNMKERGILQAFSTANVAEEDYDKFYVIIVTLGDCYQMNQNLITPVNYDEFGHDKLSEDSIFIMDIIRFEELISYLKNKDFPLIELLDYAIEQNKLGVMSSRMFLTDHIKSFQDLRKQKFEYHKIKFITNLFKEIANNIIDNLNRFTGDNHPYLFSDEDE